jgi:hypothetical protein
MNDQATTLESRIATALAATDITSSDLSQLLIEADAAIAAADKTAEEERSKALDPALSPDPKVARAAMEDAAFTRDRLKTLLPRLQTKHKEVADAEALTAWTTEANELGERRFVLGAEFRTVFSKLIDDIVDRLWAMRDLDQEITALNNRRPINAANAAGVRFLDFITPAFAKFLKIPDPEVGEKYWENGRGYLWPPRQLSPGEQMARAMMAGTYPMDNFTDHLNWYEKMEERHRRMLEDNRKQIAEAEQRQREREEPEAAEARKAQEAERAAYYAKHGWPT